MPKRPPTWKPPAPALASTRPADKVERDKFYGSARWRRVRDVQLSREPLCADCLKLDILTPATIVHHVKERLERPDLALDPRNLESLCSPCHTAKHKKATHVRSDGVD